MEPTSPEFQQRVTAAIEDAERDTSGEIRVHIQDRVKGDIFAAARKRFEELGMAATEQRNGVLFYLAVKDHRFAVLGDQGIDERVPDGFWQETVDTMRGFFAQDDLVGGLEAGIRQAGKALKEYFPYQRDDVNELSDEISYGEH
jgi:uncharacterized membrane protein